MHGFAFFFFLRKDECFIFLQPIVSTHLNSEQAPPPEAGDASPPLFLFYFLCSTEIKRLFAGLLTFCIHFSLSHFDVADSPQRQEAGRDAG